VGAHPTVPWTVPHPWRTMGTMTCKGDRPPKNPIDKPILAMGDDGDDGDDHSAGSP
jgi:hypothetical protein